jgi:hypothetical protein
VLKRGQNIFQQTKEITAEVFLLKSRLRDMPVGDMPALSGLKVNEFNYKR